MEKDIHNTVIQSLLKACNDCSAIHASIIPELSLDQLGMDSLKLVEVVYELEQVYSVQFGEEDILNLQYVGDLISLLESHRDAAQGAA